MATKQQLLRALDKVGGTLHDVGEGIYVLDSPDGLLWHTDTHTILTEYRTIDGPMPEFWDSLLDDVMQGVYPCNGWQDGMESAGPCERCHG